MKTSRTLEIGPQNKGEYDVWSHGPNGHSEEENASLVVSNWRVPTTAVPEEKKEKK